MKCKLLFIIFCITTLTFTGCGKTETPVMSNSVETEVETETITVEETSTDEVEEPTENLTEETVENNQEVTTSTVDSTGSNFQIEEGDYVEPSAEELEAAENFTPNSDYSQYSSETQRAIAKAKEMYDKGLFTEEEYLDIVEDMISIDGNDSSSNSNLGGYGQIQLTPEQQAAADAMYNNGKGVGDQRTNIQYGNAEVPDDLKGNILGN